MYVCVCVCVCLCECLCVVCVCVCNLFEVTLLSIDIRTYIRTYISLP